MILIVTPLATGLDYMEPPKYNMVDVMGSLTGPRDQYR